MHSSPHVYICIMRAGVVILSPARFPASSPRQVWGLSHIRGNCVNATHRGREHRRKGRLVDQGKWPGQAQELLGAGGFEVLWAAQGGGLQALGEASLASSPGLRRENIQGLSAQKGQPQGWRGGAHSAPAWQERVKFPAKGSEELTEFRHKRKKFHFSFY